MSLANSSIYYAPASSHAVINGSFDRDVFKSMWDTFYVDSNGNPTGSRPFPFPQEPFVAESKAFIDVIGKNATLSTIAQANTSQFHEAGIYVSSTNEVYFTSNILNTTTSDGTYTYPIYASLSKISLNSTNGTYHWETVRPSTSSFVLPNGGALYNGKLLMAVQGYQLSTPAALIAVDPVAKNPDGTLKSQVLLNNFYGRPFNSLNDVAILMRGKTGATPVDDQWVFFTGKSYPRLPSQVYAFHPPSGTIVVVEDQLQRPNGIQFSTDMKTCYISDTGFLSEDPADPAPKDGTGPGTIYAYDVVQPPQDSDPTTDPPALRNKRLFAFTDNVTPDGLKLDQDGNVYGGCFDGVHVWNKNGALLGKILLGLDIPSDVAGVPAGRGAANMAFVPGGLVMFSEDRMYFARIKAKGALLE
ncbi:SMP-30/gluconolaconase/LRE-like region protein [Ceratobasidium sp. AG-Ba]|nr:SMP-30/gluconolaconase/LRE-like region protein [Ceratobasidium sp. AG-Ba]QRW06283.1 SMP-30/gluconolaconase/LRE-like region protein [Ceratobasidium sp. AG-Ba]